MANGEDNTVTYFVWYCYGGGSYTLPTTKNTNLDALLANIQATGGQPYYIYRLPYAAPYEPSPPTPPPCQAGSGTPIPVPPTPPSGSGGGGLPPTPAPSGSGDDQDEIVIYLTEVITVINSILIEIRVCCQKPGGFDAACCDMLASAIGGVGSGLDAIAKAIGGLANSFPGGGSTPGPPPDFTPIVTALAALQLCLCENLAAIDETIYEKTCPPDPNIKRIADALEDLDKLREAQDARWRAYFGYLANEGNLDPALVQILTQ